MARPLRIELAGGLYHVTARGDRREPIYRGDADRTAWLTLFGEVCERFNWRCHGWCQMTNHYHFAIETPDANLSAGMRQLNGVYTQHFNRAHRLVGHLFQGRFKAIARRARRLSSGIVPLCRGRYVGGGVRSCNATWGLGGSGSVVVKVAPD